MHSYMATLAIVHMLSLQPRGRSSHCSLLDDRFYGQLCRRDLVSLPSVYVDICTYIPVHAL